ncbi:GRAM domain-containing protein 2A-like [Corvus moneduloides]|uniref:GRAM domain-containing protein 2A-like n=1 Tax=Corvus moneduloides TaxID=1196302 RepID=UPI00136455B3|nr:GRAM domain-containing protein 2A-like [Corvus moneduloides]
MDCGVPVEPRNATGLQSAAGLWLCRSGSQHCWDWSAFAAGLGGGWVVPHASGGRAGAHPAQPRGVPGWGCPGRSLRTRRGRPAPPAAFPQEEEEEEEEEVAAEQERRWKEWERDSSDGTGGTWLCPPAVEEQVGDPGSCCAAGMDRPHNLPPLPELSDSSLLPGKLRRGRQRVLGEKQWRSLEERGSAQLGQPKLTRSRTYESSCKETEQEATGRQGPPSPSLSKQDSSYRRAFGELAEQNVLLGCFSCAWQREVPYHGRLYVSSHHICFHSNLLLKDIKAVVPVDSITALKKTNMARLVPNAISIRTAKGEKFLFVSLRQREATYQLLRSVCKHLQDSGQSPRDSVGSEETLRKSPILKQSGLEQSTPEPNSLQESLDEPSPRSRQAEEEDDEVALLVPSSSEWVPSAGTRGLWGGPHTVLCTWATALWSRILPQLSPLNIIIIIYLLLMVALLLSSGYIGLRIVELEQQLAFVGAQPNLNLSQQYKTT